VFIIQTYFTNASADRGVKTHYLSGLDAEVKNNSLKWAIYTLSEIVWARLIR